MLNRKRQLAADRARLAAWLREWALDRALRQADRTEETGTPRGGGPYAEVRGKGRLATGQIRLLPPLTERTAERPVYVALLSAPDATRWLVAPFGRFATPAFSGELATRRRTPMLRVLCVWNAGILSGDWLQAAYPAGRLTTSELRQATDLRAALADRDCPFARPERVGPPLVHPLDPRHLYVEEERALWLEFDLSSVTGLVWGETLQLAAERPESYRTR